MKHRWRWLGVYWVVQAIALTLVLSNCWCGETSFFAFLATLAITAWAMGPAIFYAALRRRRRRRHGDAAQNEERAPASA